jgi:molybdopterin-guanine dinucleotide biosynthesis protein A
MPDAVQAAQRPVTAAVLAGGRSRRMGASKATLELGGEPLLARPLRACREAELRTVVVAKPGSELPELDFELWTESAEPHHPLAGIVEALHGANGPVLACAGDMPFLQASLLAWIATFVEELVVVCSGGRVHPLLGLYTPALLEQLEDALVQERSLTATVEALDPRWIDDAELRRFGDPSRLLFNVNDDRDLERARRLLAAG